MKKIALLALVVLSSAAFAGGRNAAGPQNPPQPPTPEQQEQARICGDFYERQYPGLNRAEASLPENDTVATFIPNTILHGVANVMCVVFGPMAAMESLCREARADGWACVVNPKEEQWTRPYP